MNNEELKSKIDMLGQMMFDLQTAQEAFDKAHEAESTAIEKLKNEIKAEVMNLGQTVETLKLKVEFRRGSTRWDTKFLEGYVLNHPELLRYKLEGKPTVAFKLKDESLFD